MDNIAAAGAKIDVEDIILYTLNGLPSQYQSFKIAIRTKLTLISLEDLYNSLLISEEINVATNFAKETNGIQSQAAKYANSGEKSAYSYKGKAKNNFHKSGNNKYDQIPKSGNNYELFSKSGSSTYEQFPKSNHNNSFGRSVIIVTCQICGKRGHSAMQCWHCMNENYRPQKKVLFTAANLNPAEWYMDSDASSHITLIWKI